MNKKISVCISAFCIVVVGFLFSSCNKDGVYNPGKKISKITTNKVVTYDYDEESNSSSVIQDYVWEKNQLKQIIHKSIESDGNVWTWTEDFSYDKTDRLIRVEDKENGEYTTYEYDGDNLSKVCQYSDGFKSVEYNLTYKESKLSEIECMEFDSYYYATERENKMNPLELACSPEIAEMVAADIALKEETQPRQKLDVEIYTISFEWDGDNIEKCIWTYPSYNERYEYLLSYDDKINPFAGFFGLYFDNSYDDYYIYKNKNNIIKMTQIGSTWQSEYTYTYTGKYPETYKYTNTYSWGKTYYTCKIEYK